MLESQLLQRKQQFEQCVDCHQQTLQQKPIAKVIMSYHQILCNICQNTSVHIVPIGDPINDDQPAKVYKKIFCKIHSKNVRKCKQCFIYLNEKGYSQCPKCNYSIFRCNMDKWKKLYPYYTCQICSYQYCLTCKNPLQMYGPCEDEPYFCYQCKKDSQSLKQQAIDFLMHFNSFRGVRLLIFTLLLIFLLPLVLVAKVFRKSKRFIIKDTDNGIKLFIEFLIFIALGPLIILGWYIICFIPYYQKRFKKHFQQAKVYVNSQK